MIPKKWNSLFCRRYTWTEFSIIQHMFVDIQIWFYEWYRITNIYVCSLIKRWLAVTENSIKLKPFNFNMSQTVFNSKCRTLTISINSNYSKEMLSTQFYDFPYGAWFHSWVNLICTDISTEFIKAENLNKQRKYATHLIYRAQSNSSDESTFSAGRKLNHLQGSLQKWALQWNEWKIIDHFQLVNNFTNYFAIVSLVYVCVCLCK